MSKIRKTLGEKIMFMVNFLIVDMQIEINKHKLIKYHNDGKNRKNECGSKVSEIACVEGALQGYLPDP